MKVMFATPCYISAVSMNYTVGIFDLVMHTKRFGPECILHMHSESLRTSRTITATISRAGGV